MSRSTTLSERTRRLALFGLLIPALALGACSGQPNSMTAPSATPGSTLVRPAEPGGGSVKNFSVTVSPASLPSGTPGFLTVTITNSGSSTHALGSVQIFVPTGLTVTSVGAISAGDDYWASSWTTGQTVEVGAATDPAGGQQSGDGNQKLDPGESATFQIGVTPTICGVLTFTNPAGSSETLPNAFSADWTYTGATLSVEVTDCVCTTTYGQGYWKNHSGVWPVTSLTLGARSYSQTELISILSDTSDNGNGLIILSIQLIAAKLNRANGAPNTNNVDAQIAAADTLIGSLVVPPVGSDWVATSTVQTIKNALEAFNKSCSDD